MDIRSCSTPRRAGGKKISAASGFHPAAELRAPAEALVSMARRNQLDKLGPSDRIVCHHRDGYFRGTPKCRGIFIASLHALRCALTGAWLHAPRTLRATPTTPPPPPTYLPPLPPPIRARAWALDGGRATTHAARAYTAGAQRNVTGRQRHYSILISLTTYYSPLLITVLFIYSVVVDGGLVGHGTSRDRGRF